jgi:hypothetical protein
MNHLLSFKRLLGVSKAPIVMMLIVKGKQCWLFLMVQMGP